MPASFEEFRSSLVNADSRRTMDIELTDAEAQRIHDDAQASRSWYDHWLTTTGGVSPAADSRTEARALGGHDFAPAGTFEYAPPPSIPLESKDASQKKRGVGFWVTTSTVGTLLLITIIVVVVAFTTARHWTKVDSPGKPETFHSEGYDTGLDIVTDDGVNPCAVDQDWTDCIGLMDAEYTAACEGASLAPSAEELCAEYREELDRMTAEDAEGALVGSLGEFGRLTRTPETETREVSNNDHEPEVSHKAVCYLGILGECE